MSIKLYNKSKLPDEPLRSLLMEAKQLAGANGPVVSKITKGGYAGSGGHAHRAAFVYEWHLQDKRRKDRTKLGRRITTRGGWIELSPAFGGDSLAMAQWMWEAAIHEYAHIVQFQTGKFLGGSPSRFDYSKKWKHRPHELDAVNRTDDALARLQKQRDRKIRIDDMIIQLAIQLDECATI